MKRLLLTLTSTAVAALIATLTWPTRAQPTSADSRPLQVPRPASPSSYHSVAVNTDDQAHLPAVVILPAETSLYPRTIGVRSSGRAVTGISLACALPAPTLLTPAQGATSADLQLPKYTWSAVTGAGSYVFQVSATNSFTTPLATEEAYPYFITDIVIVHWSFQNLSQLTTYYWRVAPICADGSFGPFSEAASFKTSTPSTLPCTLPPPKLLEPPAGAVLTTLLPSLVFATVPNGNEYLVEASRTLDFSLFDPGSRVRFYGVRPEYTPKGQSQLFENLKPSTLYYWRVTTACAETDTIGTPSSAHTFTTGSGTTLPPPPSLLSPDDGATTGSIRVVLSHSTVPTATSYWVSAGNIAYFSSNSYVTTINNPNTLVSWQVRSQNDVGYGEWSATRTFTTPVVLYTADVTPGAGGTVAPSGALTLVFPPGSVSANTTVNYSLLQTPAHSTPNFAFANRSFTLQALSGGSPFTHFAKPYMLTLTYDAADLVAAGITDASKLNVYFWDSTSNQWKGVLPCAGCSVNTTTKTLTAVLDHFTEFMLAAPVTTPTPSHTYVYLPLAIR